MSINKQPATRVPRHRVVSTILQLVYPRKLHRKSQEVEYTFASRSAALIASSSRWRCLRLVSSGGVYSMPNMSSSYSVAWSKHQSSDTSAQESLLPKKNFLKVQTFVLKSARDLAILSESALTPQY